jgi:hypothetical protein
MDGMYGSSQRGFCRHHEKTLGVRAHDYLYDCPLGSGPIVCYDAHMRMNKREAIVYGLFRVPR